MLKTLGGDRLGAGNKIKVATKHFERSTHDLGYTLKTTMSAGTLVPFLKQLALPGDTWDINLGCAINTHPTIGPLFGSAKVQLDIFQAPIRLYNALLHNNALKIGLNISQVKLPVATFTIPAGTPSLNPQVEDLDNSQVNPSALLSYLGIRGYGVNPQVTDATRDFQMVPLLAYHEIYKQYYANKQEEIGAVIHTPNDPIVNTILGIEVQDLLTNFQAITEVGSGAPGNTTITAMGYTLNITWATTKPIPNQIMLITNLGPISAEDLCYPFIDISPTVMGAQINFNKWGQIVIQQWRYINSTDLNNGIQITTFPLENIDQMREAILGFNSRTTPFNIVTDYGEIPYQWIGQITEGRQTSLGNQEGLLLKTYQSDLFNNWLSTEWIDGTNGINDVTAIDVSGGELRIDELILQKKVYEMLNDIAVSGGTYDDWLDAVYDHPRSLRAETPMYMGGLIKELAFQEVVSNSQSVDQPLGTLAGKGVFTGKHKGGKIVIKVDEPSYIIGIISITPRICYSQGNDWDINLQTLDDLHKPHLDQLGFQNLTTGQLAWWDEAWQGGVWSQKAAGKQPAWINYMTNVDKVKGNFAIGNENLPGEMFMTFNRRYENIGTDITPQIKDLTTYIDPTKYNYIFAQTSLDAQNYWVQIGMDIKTRRKMSAKQMPNL